MNLEQIEQTEKNLGNTKEQGSSTQQLNALFMISSNLLYTTLLL